MSRDGGPAFPRPHSWDESPVQGMHEGDRVEPYSAQDGMTLRDYFAAAALTGILVNWKDGDPDAAPNAYALAEEMLRARKR